ncbi:2',3'-cyclic-nucleotide 2'-phosphodiesterase [Paenibacillus yonginensis]|uniref:2',3'-cyclic-nucleotide 2'-phosphodiesterase n=2 Tax=Paenibacillus yonginensis TaxID=1462996 RepID=A0A1B1N7H0_9BACL|nr:2',3'-cyclic-nucleotide 2'-phosphodiesterase [Paenibacillus yonginensis]
MAKLRIMATTDVHVHLLGYDYYADQEAHHNGLVYTSALIRQARLEAPNHLLLDNGDILQGSPMGDYEAQKAANAANAAADPAAGKAAGAAPGSGEKSSIHPVFKAMNYLGYEAGTLGNHEFNYGLEYLQQCLAMADFPYTNANIIDAGSGLPLFNPFVMLDKPLKCEDGSVSTVKVGLIGFVPPQIMQWDKSNLEGKIQVRDMLETAREWIPVMKEQGAEIVVALVHAGYEELPETPYMENAALHFGQVPDVDAIVFGHAHKLFPGPFFEGKTGADNERGTLHGIPAVEPGYAGEHLGIIDLELEHRDGKWRVANGRAECRPVYDTAAGKPLVEPDEELARLLEDSHQEVLAYIRGAVGQTTGPINSYFSLLADDSSVQLINDAQRDYTRRQMAGTVYEGLPVLAASAPFKTGGRYGPAHFTSIPAGGLAIKHIADLYNYPNTLHALHLNGAELKEWLEWAAGLFTQIDPDSAEEQPLVNPDFPSFNFDVIDGVDYVIDVTKPARYDAAGKLVHPESSRIVSLTYEGRPVGAEQFFVVATNSYRAFSSELANPGGQRIVLASTEENRQVLTQYIRDTGTFHPYADGNWRLLPTGGQPVITYLTSPKALEAAKQWEGLQFEGINEAGFAKFRVNLDRLKPSH